MHMAFTGNPGTAKTTVARLLARILKEEGVLEGGQLVEVGRDDLVGKYVGWTAPTVKGRFEEARGGILFIDEAYSLLDDRRGLFGDEALSTIVREMENHRRDTVVVLAGYPDEMDALLSRNPGLRSRVAFHVPFDDYDADELCLVAEHIARDSGFEFGSGTMEKLRAIFSTARIEPEFGNGRYARTLVERARMRQASRLLACEDESITEGELRVLKPEDFALPERKACPKIGFSC